MPVTKPEFAASLCEHMYSSMKQGKYPDVVFEMRGLSVSLHLPVLSYSSDYFEDNVDKLRDIFSQFDDTVVNAMLAYCYLGIITIDEDRREKFSELANFLQIRNYDRAMTQSSSTDLKADPEFAMLLLEYIYNCTYMGLNKFTDININVRNRRRSVHMLVLSGSSEFFEKNLPILNGLFSGFEDEVIDDVLKYCYTGEKPTNNYEQFKRLAEHLRIKSIVATQIPQLQMVSDQSTIQISVRPQFAVSVCDYMHNCMLQHKYGDVDYFVRRRRILHSAVMSHSCESFDDTVPNLGSLLREFDDTVLDYTFKYCYLGFILANKSPAQLAIAKRVANALKIKNMSNAIDTTVNTPGLAAEQKFANAMMLHLHNLRMQRQYMDFDIRVRNTRFGGHMVVLSYSSDIFQIEELSGILSLFTDDVIEAVFQYCYTGEIHLDNRHHDKFRRLAKLMQIRGF